MSSTLLNIIRYASYAYLLLPDKQTIRTQVNTISSATELQAAIDEEGDMAMEYMALRNGMNEFDYSQVLKAELTVDLGFKGDMRKYTEKISSKYILKLTNLSNQDISIAGIRINWSALGCSSLFFPYVYNTMFTIPARETSEVSFNSFRTKDLFAKDEFNAFVRLKLVESGVDSPLTGNANIIFLIHAGNNLVGRYLLDVPTNVYWRGNVEYTEALEKIKMSEDKFFLSAINATDYEMRYVFMMAHDSYSFYR